MKGKKTKKQTKNHIKRFGSNFRHKLQTRKGWNTGDLYSEELPRDLFSQPFHCPEKHTSVCMEHLCPSTGEQPQQVCISFSFVYLCLLLFYNLSCVTRRICTNYFLQDSNILHRIVPWTIPFPLLREAPDKETMTSTPSHQVKTLLRGLMQWKLLLWLS